MVFRYDQLPILETERLILRPVTMDDLQDIFEYASDPEVTKLLVWGPNSSIEEPKQMILFWLDNYKNNNVAPWVIVYKADNKVIGTFEVRTDQQKPNEIELGYVLSSYYWGKGLMVEAIHCVIHYLGHLGYKTIIAFIRNDNIQSQRVCEKAGFHLERPSAKQEMMKGKMVSLDRWVKKL